MSTTQETEKYNGWANYETWNCKLWIDNEQGSQEYWREVARWAQANPVENEYMTLERRIVHALADNIKEQFEEQAEAWMKGQASFFADIFNAGLSRVNWHEIAESLIEELDEA
jgi:hypothetical protein